jgi:hypothetical protein
MNRPFLTALMVLTALRVVAADFATEMMEATFKFGQDNSGTCFLLRRDAPDTAVYLVTVAHALNDNSAETAVIALRKLLPDGSYERHDYNVPLRRDGKPLWVRHPQQDVAVLRIHNPLPVPVAALSASSLADADQLKTSAVRLCSPLFVLGYPKGLEASDAGLPVARQGIVASSILPLSAKHPTFMANFQAFPGDSGAPVFMEGADHHPLLLGLVVEQHYYTDTLKGAFQEHIIRNALGVANILQAQCVRETLEAAAKQNSKN